MTSSKTFLCAAALIFSSSLLAQDRAVLVHLAGPHTYSELPGQHVVFNLNFPLQQLIHGPYELAVDNHHESGARITLNGQTIFGHGDLHPGAQSRVVTLQAENLVTIELQDPHGSLTLAVIGFQYEFAPQYGAVAVSTIGPSGATTIDWRTRGVVTPVRNEGQFPGDWVFSAVGALESSWALKTGSLISLSTQQVIDCSHTLFNPASALEYLINKRAASESSYPYTARYGTCRTFTPVARASSMLRAPIADEATLASLLVAAGPLSVVLDGSWFPLYSRGIASPDCESAPPNFRAALLVGMGVDAATNTPYWLLKNSLGTAWGESGYFRLARGRNLCGIADYAIVPVI